MYQTLIPLDMIWIDSSHKIVEIVENAQPCKTQASKCPQYGGNQVIAIHPGDGRRDGEAYGLRRRDRIIDW